MIDLTQLFSAVCGQNPNHSWAPGGMGLPFCQRCTGLYCGAGLAAVLHLWLKPRSTAVFVATHGGFLLLMVPFGYHWVPQGPLLRCLTGVLFGFAVVAFLWLPLKYSAAQEPFSSGIGGRTRLRPGWPYVLALCSTVLVVPWIGAHGGKLTGTVLTYEGFWGATALVILILANLWQGTMAAFNVLVSAARTHTG